MTIYINADTNEYPRYEADVFLDPAATWVEVEEVATPVTANDEMAYQVTPILVEGKYVQQWKIRKLSEDELNTTKP